MSQRLYVGVTNDPGFDAVITCVADVTEERLVDWLYPGPWKIVIGDIYLWRRVDRPIAELFPGVFPNDVWWFYFRDWKLEHPTAEELEDWIQWLLHHL